MPFIDTKGNVFYSQYLLFTYKHPLNCITGYPGLPTFCLVTKQDLNIHDYLYDTPNPQVLFFFVKRILVECPTF